MNFYRRIISIILALTLVLALPLIGFAETTITYSTNGNAGDYGPGSELTLVGKLTDGNVTLKNTEVTVTVSCGAMEIHYAKLKTDSNGYFSTTISVPGSASGSLSINITAAGTTITDEVTLKGQQNFDFLGFVDCVGYLQNDPTQTISADISQFGLLFTGNVNYYNNKNSSLTLSSLGYNERNRDCFTLYKKNSAGTFTKISSSVDLVESRETGDVVIDKSRITLLPGVTITDNGGQQGANKSRKDMIFVKPSDKLEPETTYKLVISGKLSGNSSATLGENVSLYFTTESTGNKGSSGGSSVKVEATPTVTGNQAVVQFQDSQINEAIEKAKGSNANTLELTVPDGADKGASAFVFKFTESQILSICSGMEFVAFNTASGLIELPRSAFADLNGSVSLEINRISEKEDTYTVSLSDSKGKITSLNGFAKFEFPVSVKGSSSTIITNDEKIMKDAIIKDYKAYGITNVFGDFAIKENNKSFNDADSHWAKETIQFLSAREVVNGMSADRFAPNQKVTRAEFVKMLTNSIDWLTIGKSEPSSFNDVKQGMWYSDCVAWAEEANVAYGYSDGTFGVNKTITRQEMAVMIDRFAQKMDIDFTVGADQVAFSDHDSIAEYAKDAIYKMQQAGVINGKNDNRFDPLGYATRAEAARMIEGMIENLVLAE